MLDILTVCTGNICRSPIAAQVLAQHLANLGVRVNSAGTRAREGMRMTPEAVELATSIGVPKDLANAHGARMLTDERLMQADFALAMARDHRREIVELNPASVRKTFTVRELHRLVNDVDDAALQSAADSAPQQTPRHRLAGVLAYVGSLRGALLPPGSPSLDDVVDPYGQSLKVYEASIAQISESLPSVERVVRSALTRIQVRADHRPLR